MTTVSKCAIHTSLSSPLPLPSPDEWRFCYFGLLGPVRPSGAASERGKNTLLKWALIFFVISVVAGFFGFSGLSAATAGIARILFFIAIAIFAIFILLAIFAGQAIL